MTKPVANIGAVILSRAKGVKVTARLVVAGDENRLTGYDGLPVDLNPYQDFGRVVPAVAAIAPPPGKYDLVFDTPAGTKPGRFTFRVWSNDVTPPSIRILRARSAAVLHSDSPLPTRAQASTRVDRREGRRQGSAVRLLTRRPAAQERPEGRHAPLHIDGLRLRGGEEHGERRTDPAEHAARRAGRASCASAGTRPRSSAGSRGRARRSRRSRPHRSSAR